MWYSEGFNYSRDPNRDIKPRDYPILSHYFEIPQTYYRNASMETIYPEHLDRHRYGHMGGEREGVIGGYSERDTFQQMLKKDRSLDTGYIVYKKHRLDVIVEVRDGKGKPIPDAYVDLGGNTYKTGSKGRIMVELDPDRYRDKHLPFAIRKPYFKDEKHSLMAFQMKPSTDFLIYPVDMEAKDLDILIGELDKKLAEKRNALNRACSSIGDELQSTEAKVEDVRKIYKAIEYWGSIVPQTHAACTALPGLRTQVRNAASDVQAKSPRLQALIDEANAVDFKTSADERRLKALWAQIHTLSRDIHDKAINVDSWNTKIQKTIDLSNFIYPYLYPDPVSGLMGSPGLSINSLSHAMEALRKQRGNQLKSALDRVKSLREDCLRAHDNAAAQLAREAAALGLGSDPRVDAFKKHAEKMKPRKGQPCDEAKGAEWKTMR
jgi:hypothetical protein